MPLHHSAQLSLFGARPLVDERILKRFLDESGRSPAPGAEAAEKFLSTFSKVAGKRDAKETSLEQSFGPAIFKDYLGYTFYPADGSECSAWPKPSTRRTKLAGEPDLLLGHISSAEFRPVAVVEFKKPGVPLDGPQASYGYKSPVEQAFEYAQGLSDCRWIIVSDMRFLRIYEINDPKAYDEFDLWSKPEDVRNIHRLISREKLLTQEPNDSTLARLLEASRREHEEIQAGFYKVYSEIRSDLIEHIRTWAASQPKTLDEKDIILASQRLVDRMMFIYFCEDHPERLLQKNLVKETVASAVRSPGPSKTKAYTNLKNLFRDLDVGNQTPFFHIPAYNGELFKPHDIVDNVDLPDSLHLKRYRTSNSSDGTAKVVEGAWGLHVFDFWGQLDKDLLGHVFERSIGDLEVLAKGDQPNPRAAFGVFYTAARLAKFVAGSVLGATLQESSGIDAALADCAAAGKASDFVEAAERLVAEIKKVKVIDFACGSGVFLTSALDRLLVPYRKALESTPASQLGAIERQLMTTKQAGVLSECIHGIDILPAAVELAKLALWLTAARINEKSADLSGNFAVGDTLDMATRQSLPQNGQFDVVLGNPPWGGVVDSRVVSGLLRSLSLPTDREWDSWEAFVAAAWTLLKKGGRLGVLVPDTLFSPEKAKIRKFLKDRFRLEKVYSLGPDWFGPEVRMGTVVIQGVKL